MVAFPFECETCPEEEKKDFGCGWIGLDGKGTMKYEHGAKDDHYSKTCPQYCIRQEWVQRVLNDMGYLANGALGNVLDLENQYLTYLEVAKAEQARWEQVDMDSISDG